MILLDTSIAVWLLRGREDVVQRAKQEGDVGIAWITHAELLVGAFYPGADADLARKIRRFADSVAVLYPTAATCERYAQLQADLRRAGTQIPSNDTWIAALALQLGLTVVTADEHFAQVPELSTDSWIVSS